jgi:purine-binding chemotaxis protein CheW
MAGTVTAVEAAAPTGDPLQLIVFSVAGEPYALPISQIQEVVRYREPRSIATRVSWITGVLNLRGEILAVGDLAARLGVTARPGGQRRIVIVKTPAGAAGLVVDSVDEVAMVAREQLDRPPATDDDSVLAIAKLEDRLVVILDAPALLGALATPTGPDPSGAAATSS